VLNNGCESWTWNKAMHNKVNAFQMWCYRRMLKISWTDKVKNAEILNTEQVVLNFIKDMKKRKLKFGRQVMRSSSGNAHLYILEGQICGKRQR